MPACVTPFSGNILASNYYHVLTVLAALCIAGLVDVLRNHRVHAVCMQCSEEDEINGAKTGGPSAQEVAAHFSLMIIPYENIRMVWVSRCRCRYRFKCRCSCSCSFCMLCRKRGNHMHRGSADLDICIIRSSSFICMLMYIADAAFIAHVHEELVEPSASDGTDVDNCIALMREIAPLCCKAYKESSCNCTCTWICACTNVMYGHMLMQTEPQANVLEASQ